MKWLKANWETIVGGLVWTIIIGGFIYFVWISPSQKVENKPTTSSVTTNTTDPEVQEYNAERAQQAYDQYQQDRADEVAQEQASVQQDSCLIKGNISYNTGEKIYHVPGCPHYNSTVINESYGERWFCTEQEAINAGWRHCGGY